MAASPPKKNARSSTSPPQYCRNGEDIARALGVRLLEQRNRKAKQLAEIRDWTNNVGLPPGAPPFPVKQPNGYWLRSEVEAWNSSRLNLNHNLSLNQAGGGKGGIKIKSKNEGMELPVQPDAPLEGDLFLQPASEQDKKIRLLHQFKKWQEAKSSKRDEEDLLRAGMITADQVRDHFDDLPDVDDATSKNIGGGYRGVANFINTNFPWVNANHEKIQRWVRSEYMPPGCREPFPPPDDGNRFKRALVEDWIRRWCPAPSALGQSLPLNIVELRDQAEKEEIEHQRWVRESERQATDRNYIRVDVMLGIADEVGNAAYQAVYQTERDRVRLFETDAEVQAAPEAERARWLAIVRRLVPEASRIIVAEQTKGFGALKERAADKPET